VTETSAEIYPATHARDCLPPSVALQ